MRQRMPSTESPGQSDLTRQRKPEWPEWILLRPELSLLDSLHFSEFQMSLEKFISFSLDLQDTVSFKSSHSASLAICHQNRKNFDTALLHSVPTQTEWNQMER